MMQKLHFGIGAGLSNLIRDAFWFEQRFNWAEETLDCFDGITKEQKQSILMGEAHLKPIENGKRVLLVYKVDKEFKKLLDEQIVIVIRKIEKLSKEHYDLQWAKRRAEGGFFSTGESTERAVLLGKFIHDTAHRIEKYQMLIYRYNQMFKKNVSPNLTVRIGGYDIPKPLLDEYTNDVVKRLREVMSHPALLTTVNPIRLLELEQRRKELHDKILRSVKLTKRDGDKYWKFSNALEKHLEFYGAGLGVEVVK